MEPTEKVARPYQLHLLEHAIKHNSIIYLPTGSGKTYIAIMLIRHYSKEFHIPLNEGGKRCIFLCNTVELARQNARQIALETNFRVGLFIGDMNVDNWPLEKWNAEMAANQVFVGTSQVFVDMISHNHLSIKQLSCIIMDECHHATKSHPMHQLLSFVDNSKTPRVVGLTGVLIKSSKKGNVLEPLNDMEAVFRGKIITVQNMGEYHNVLTFSTNPNEIMIQYVDSSIEFEVERKIKEIVTKCCDQIDNWDLGEKIKYSKNLETLREPNKLKQVKSLLTDFVYQMDDMGLYAASIAILAAIVQLEVNKRNAETICLRNMYRYVLTRCEHIRHIIIKKMESTFDEDEDIDESDIICNFAKPKLQALLSYFVREFPSKKGDEISCLVFVQRRYTAKCLYFVLKKFAQAHHKLNHIIPEFMVGRATGMIYSMDTILDSKWNRQAIQRFRQKECNVIVCSSVLEEGIDVQSCNYVISFDEIKQFSSYVQMKGRARSQESTYAVICEKSKAHEVASKIRTYKQTDKILKDYLITRTVDRDIPEESKTQEQFKETIKSFKAPSGAILKAEATLMLLHRYCQTMPNDMFTRTQALWSVVVPSSIVSLQMPMQSTIKDIIFSDPMKSTKLAKMSAAFKACVKLYENGELNESLLPVTQKQIVENVTDIYFQKWKKYSDDDPSIAGSNKNIREYLKIYPEELTAAQPVPGEITYAYCIQIKPKFAPTEDNIPIITMLESKSNYAIVTKKKLPALASMPLFMTQGVLKAIISSEPFEFVVANEDELKKLKLFNKMLFSDIRDFWDKKKFLGIDNRNGVNSYLIAPVQNDCSIDWQLVNKFQKLTVMRPRTIVERQRYPPKAEDFIGKVVNTWYGTDENLRYAVTKIRDDLNPLSSFETNQFSSFAEYVEKKYHEKVINEQQFLIEVKPLTSRTNFFNNPTGKTTESKRLKRHNTVILIPEMCHNFQYPGDLWLKCLFLPSILHRVHYILNAEKLRVDINNYLNIPMPSNYKPESIKIDYSLRRVGSEVEEKEKIMLPPLDNTHFDNSRYRYNLVDLQEGNWKQYIEPIDVYRNVSSIYPIEVDYYYQFVNNLLEDMEKLKLDATPEASMNNLEAFQPKIEQRHIDELTRRIASTSFESNEDIKILDAPTSKTAEQYEFLAAITNAKSNDVFDMERFEVLGDSFLKISTSLILMHKHPTWNEGFLTTIKGRLVSNRNLLYCMREKYNGSFISSTMFDPTCEWLPPMAAIPKNILHAIENNGLSPNVLHVLGDMQLKQHEIESGNCDEDTMDIICTNTQYSEASTQCFDEFLYKQSVPDKVVADCLEALLGVCVKNYGVKKSFEMLDYFGIYNDKEKKLLPKLLEIKLESTVVKTGVKKSEVDSYLLNYEYLEKNLSYTFKDRAYLLQALTHPSYPTNRITGCYQQLEFLGDAILDFLISCYIFERCTHMNPGEITDLRSALVNNITLACVCVRNRFHQYLLYESPKLSESIRKFVEFQNTKDHRVTDQVNILLEETVDPETFNLAENIDVPKALGDILEAIIGAVFLDSGNDLRCTWKVIYNLLNIEINDFILKVPLDPVRQLYEYKGASPTFEVECIEEDVVLVKCQFYCRDAILTTNGCGGNKTLAKKAAAKMALQILLSN